MVLVYEFTCSNKNCKCLKEGLGLYFTTTDLEEAEQHSRENNSPMWVSVTNKPLPLLEEVKE